MLNVTCKNNKLDFQDYDCLSKHFLSNPTGAGVGYIGSSTKDMPFTSKDLHSVFLDNVFTHGIFGKSLTDSKLLNFISVNYYYTTERYVMLSYILLGDPQMEIWTETPKDFTLSCPDTVLECGQNFAGAHVESSGVDVEGVLVCLLKENDVYEVTYTNSDGIAHFDESFYPGDASLVASKRNLIPQSFTIEIEPFNDPTNVTATYLHNRIELSWTDNSENEDGFKIERKDSLHQWYQIATVGANIENYTDNTVECGFTYCYRLRAYSNACDGYYSYPHYPEAYATTDTCPDPECPFLYVWNGEVFVNDNVILTGSEDEYSDKSSLTDYYVFSQTLESKDGKYELEIREYENEVSRIDHLSFFAIDYPQNENIGVTPQGKVWIYSDPVSPISCVDQDGVDRLAEVITKDKEYFVSKKPGYLIVDFGKIINTGLHKPSDQMSGGGGGGIPPPPKEPQKLASFAPGSNANIVYVDVIGANGDWKNVAKVYPRTRSVLSLVELSQYVNPNEDFKMKISWDQAYSTDHIAYYKFDDAQVTLTELGLFSATHSDQGDVNTLLDSNDDQRVVLSPDQAIGLSFTALPDDSSKQRSFLLTAKGYYEKLELPAPDSSGVARIRTPEMDQNYPNPFNVTTGIRFTLPHAAKVTLNIYNILGQKVTALVDEEKAAGPHTVFWDGRDKNGAEVASGIYFYRIKAGDFKELKKMLLIK